MRRPEGVGETESDGQWYFSEDRTMKGDGTRMKKMKSTWRWLIHSRRRSITTTARRRPSPPARFYIQKKKRRRKKKKKHVALGWRARKESEDPRRSRAWNNYLRSKSTFSMIFSRRKKKISIYYSGSSSTNAHFSLFLPSSHLSHPSTIQFQKCRSECELYWQEGGEEGERGKEITTPFATFFFFFSPPVLNNKQSLKKGIRPS